MDPDRSFTLRTSKRQRVYDQEQQNIRHQRRTQVVPISTKDVIYAWPHVFDDPACRRPKPKRKSGTIRRANVPARGDTGVRDFQRLKEAEIDPHKRAKMTTAQLNAAFKK